MADFMVSPWQYGTVGNGCLAVNTEEKALALTGAKPHPASPTREEALAKAAQDFIDKVDRGEARSIKSYQAFKKALLLPQAR
jgi:hypothetical protein